MHRASELRRELRRIRRTATRIRIEPGPDYRTNPVGYIREKLGATLTPTQEEICRLLLLPPYRVLVKSGHNVGKSFIAAALISWWFDCFNPGVVISTAPTYTGVVDVLWTEVRLQRLRANLTGFNGDRAPLLYDSPDHWAKGATANSGAAFAGRHRERTLFVFDEAIAINPVFFEVADTMFTGTPGNGFLAIFNPTDPSSRVYAEEQQKNLDGSPKWHVLEMDSLQHPNIAAELAGQSAPYPSAVRLSQINTAVADECDPIEPAEKEATDIEWPPGSGQWFRPGPVFEARWKGRWPSSSIYGVWSDRRWAAACAPKDFRPDLAVLPMIGLDSARFGDDDSAFACRHCATALAFERHNGWDEARQAARCVELAHWLADWVNAQLAPHTQPIEAKQIPINVDDIGCGGGVTTILRRLGYNVRGVNVQSVSTFPDRYPRLRDELWFSLVERARFGTLDLSRLKRKDLDRLKTEAMIQRWDPTLSGQRQVWTKEEVKKEFPSVGSPDGMDSLNLAFWDGAGGLTTSSSAPARGLEVHDRPAYARRGPFA